MKSDFLVSVALEGRHCRKEDSGRGGFSISLCVCVSVDFGNCSLKLLPSSETFHVRDVLTRATTHDMRPYEILLWQQEMHGFNVR